jgi:hypothetical protein
MMVERLKNISNEVKTKELKSAVETLCMKFPVPEVMV